MELLPILELAAKDLTKMEDSAEKSIFFELLGCSLETFCLDDNVQFHRKHEDSLYKERS